MRSKQFALLSWFLGLSLVLAGCGGGGGGGGAAITATGGGPGASGTIARAPVGVQSGQVVIEYMLMDESFGRVDVVVQYSIDGGPWLTATEGPGSDGTGSLTASPAGTAHVFVWNSAADLGTRTGKVKLRLLPGGLESKAIETPDFTLDNPQPPQLTSFEPTVGSGDQNTTVRIRGSGFRGVSAVTAMPASGGASRALTGLSVLDESTIFITVPAGTPPGDYRLRVQTGVGEVQSSASFTVLPGAATVISISPSSGAGETAQPVLILGTGFGSAAAAFLRHRSSGAQVTLNGFAVPSATEIRAVVPQGTAAGEYDVFVRTEPGGAVSEAGIRYLVTVLPTLTAITPATGRTDSATPVTITGSSLLGVTAASLLRRTGPQSASLTAIQVDSNTSMRGTVPAGLVPGIYDVVLTSPSGTTARGTVVFVVNEDPPTVTSVNPVQGSNATDQRIDLNGTNLLGATAVTFVGSQRTFSGRIVAVQTGSRMTVDVPLNQLPGPYQVRVTNSVGTSTQNVIYIVTEPVPVLETLSPTQALNSSTSNVLATGRHFLGTQSIQLTGPSPSLATLNVTPVSVNLTDPTTLGYVMPSERRPGNYDVRVVNTAGLSNPRPFIVIEPFPTVTSIIPSTVSNVTDNQVALVGTSFFGASQVDLEGPENRSLFALNVQDNRNLTMTVPLGLRPGGYKALVVNTAGKNTLSPTLTITEPVPDVTTVSPASATNDTTVQITVTGSNFLGAFAALLNGPELFQVTPVTVLSVTQLTFVMPVHRRPGLYQLRIVNSAGTSLTFEDFTVTEKLPLLTAITPNSGFHLNTIPVTITGSHLVGTNEIRFIRRTDSATTTLTGGQFTVNGFSQIVGTVPNTILPGSYDVVVRNTAGFSTAIFYRALELNASVSAVNPNSGPYDSTQRVTVSGANLLGAVQSTLIPDDARPILLARQVVRDFPVLMPTGNTTVSVDVTPITIPGRYKMTVSNSNGRSDIATAPAYTVTEPLPVLTSLSPTQVDFQTGATLTLDGNHFLGALSIQLAGVSTTFSVTPTTVPNQNRVTAVLPPDSVPDNYQVTLFNTQGQSNPIGLSVVETDPSLTQVIPDQTPYQFNRTIRVLGDSIRGTRRINLVGTFNTLDLLTPAQVNLISSTEVTFVSTANTPPDSYALRVFNTTGVASNPVSFVVTEPLPVMGLCSPAVGLDTQDVTVTLSGNHLLGARSLSMTGPQTLSFLKGSTLDVISPTQVSFIVPALTRPGNYTLRLTNTQGQSANTAAYQVSELAPTLTSVTPNTGKTGAVRVVQLVGTNLLGVSQVRLQGATPTLISGSSVRVTDINNVTVDLPLQSGVAAGPYQISAINTNSESNALPFLVTQDPPVVGGISPSTGVNTGQTPVTITGARMDRVTDAVLLGASGTVSLTVGSVNFSSVPATVPSSLIPGIYNVRVDSPDGVSNTNILFTVTQPPPVITTINPTVSTNTAITLTELRGSNFLGVSRIEMRETSNPGPAIRTIQPPNQIFDAGRLNFDIPANFYPDTYHVRVVDTQGQTSNEIDHVVQEIAPVVTSVSPIVGSNDGDTTITITGQNLLGTTDIQLVGPETVDLTPTGFYDLDPTRVDTIVPPFLTPGEYFINLTNTVGTDTSNVTFRVSEEQPIVTSITPSVVSNDVATPVTIAGQNFVGTMDVFLVGTTNVSLSVSASDFDSIDATVPAFIAPGSYVVRVTNSEGTSRENVILIVNQPSATLTSIVPDNALHNVATPFVINGTNLTGTTNITFTGPITVGVNPTGVTPTTINGTTPITFLPGNYLVTIQTPAGISTNSLAYQATELLPILNSMNPTTAKNDLARSIFFDGDNLLGTRSVTFTGPTPRVVGTANITITSINAIDALIPFNTMAAGQYTVTVANTAGESNGLFPFRVSQDAPLINSVVPSAGDNDISRPAQIFGLRLDTITSVTFTGPEARVIAFTSNDFDSVDITVPAALIPGFYNIQANGPDGASNNNVQYRVTQPAPIIASIIPNTGTYDVTTTVTATGANFLGVTQVEFNETGFNPGPSPRFILPDVIPSPTQLIFSVPPNFNPDLYNVVFRDVQNQTSNTVTYTVGEIGPSLASITPNSGSNQAATAALLTGQNLLGTQNVTLVGPQVATAVFDSTSFFVDDDTRLSITIPAQLLPGTYNLSLQNTAGVVNSGVTYSVTEAVPILSFAAPNTTPNTATADVVLTGTNLLGVSTVTLSGPENRVIVPPQISGTAFTTVNVTFPTGLIPGTYNVSVTNSAGSSSEIVPFTYTASGPLVVSAFPQTAPFDAGTPFVLDGDSMLGTNNVFFSNGGNTVSVSPSSVNQNQVSGTTPTGLAPGIYNLGVTTPVGASNTVTFSFTEGPPTLTSVTPSAGLRTVDQVLDIRGTNFLGTQAITVGATSLTNIQIISDTQVLATLPRSLAPLGTHQVSLRNSVQLVTGPITYQVQAPPAPVITAITPDRGPNSGGVSVTIDGTNLSDTVTIRLDDPAVTAFVSTTNVSDTQVTAVVPAGIVPGNFRVTLNTQYGGSVQDLRYNVLFPVPVISSVSPGLGPVSGGQSVSINGSGFQQGSQVLIDGRPASNPNVVSPNQITVDTPPHPGGSTLIAVPVVVNGPDGQSATRSPGYTYQADVQNPRVIAFSPAEGSTADQNTDISVTFETAVVPGNAVFDNTFYVHQETASPGTFVAIPGGTFTSSPDGTRITFSPSSNFTSGRRVHVVLTSAISDAAGNILVNNSNSPLVAPRFTIINSSDVQDLEFTVGAGVDNTAPTVSLFSPSGAGAAITAQPVIDFSEPVDPASFLADTITLTPSNGSIPVTGSYVFSNANQRVTFRPAQVLESGVTYRSRIKTDVRDLAGNSLAAEYTATTFTTVANFNLQASTPTNGLNPVPTNWNLFLYFSTPLNPGSINNQTFDLLNNALGANQGYTPTLALNDTLVVMQPTGGLSPSVNYDITDNGTVRDTLGNNLPGPMGIDFTTGPSTDTVPVTISTLNPADQSQGESRATNITVTFDQPLDPRTVLPFTRIQVVRLAIPSFVPGVITVPPGSAQMVFNPDLLLEANEDYQVQVFPGSTDPAGNAMVGTVTTTFSTGTSTAFAMKAGAPGAGGAAERVPPWIDLFTVEGIPAEFNGSGTGGGRLLVPETGFHVDIAATDLGSGVRRYGLRVNRGIGPDRDVTDLTGDLDPVDGGARFTVDEEHRFAPGDYRLTGWAEDRNGNVSTMRTLDITVEEAARVRRPFDPAIPRVWYLDLDRDNFVATGTPEARASHGPVEGGDGTADLDQDLEKLGVMGPDAEVNAAVMARLEQSMLLELERLFGQRRDDEGWLLTDADSVGVRFSLDAPPAALPPGLQPGRLGFSVIGVGGAGGLIERTVGDPWNSLDENLSAPYVADTVTQVPGVLPFRVYDLWTGAPAGSPAAGCAAALTPGRGHPIGSAATLETDRRILAAPALAGESGATAARRLVVERGIDLTGRALARLVARCVGTASGLGPDGPQPAGLFNGMPLFPGSTSGHLAWPSDLPGLSLMQPDVTADLLYRDDVSFNPMDMAYLRGRLLYRGN